MTTIETGDIGPYIATGVKVHNIETGVKVHNNGTGDKGAQYCNWSQVAQVAQVGV